MSTTLEDLRSATRIGVRTPVIVYYKNSSGRFVRIRAWTDDLSLSGAKITSEQAIDGSKILVRIMLPDLKDQVIIAEIVREISNSNTCKLVDIRRTYYGIRFIGVADDQVRNLVGELDSRHLNTQTN